MNPYIRHCTLFEAIQTYESTSKYTKLKVERLRCWLWAFRGRVGGFRSCGESAGVHSDRSAQLRRFVPIDGIQKVIGGLRH